MNYWNLRSGFLKFFPKAQFEIKIMNYWNLRSELLTGYKWQRNLEPCHIWNFFDQIWDKLISKKHYLSFYVSQGHAKSEKKIIDECKVNKKHGKINNRVK